MSELWLIDGRQIPRLQAARRASLSATAMDRKAAAEAATVSKVPKPQMGSVAVLHLSGTLSRNPGIFDVLFGGMSTMDFSQQFDEAVSNPQVSEILILIDSPGGTVPGVMELSDKIFAARSQKRITAFADALAASAAYWIGSAATEFYCTPSGEVGSIGVFSLHFDCSQQLENEGITPTIIQTPAYKAEFNPYEPLSAEAVQHEQASIDRVYGQFTAHVARNRATTVSAVKANMGQGRTVDAETAKRANMVDGVMTLEELTRRVMDRASRKKPSPRSGGKLPFNQQAACDRNERRIKQRNLKLLEIQKAESEARRAGKAKPNFLRVISGYVIQYNKVALYPNDKGRSPFWMMCAPGCADHILAGPNNVVFTRDHDLANPIASRDAFTLDLKSDHIGVLATCRIPYSKAGYDLCNEIDKGHVTGWSMMWEPNDDREFVLIDGKQVDLVTKIDLFEVCVCVAPETPVFAPNGPAILTGIC